MASGFQSELRVARLQRMSMLAGEAFGHVSEPEHSSHQSETGAQRRWLPIGLMVLLSLLVMVVLAG